MSCQEGKVQRVVCSSGLEPRTKAKKVIGPDGGLDVAVGVVVEEALLDLHEEAEGENLGVTVVAHHHEAHPHINRVANYRPGRGGEGQEEGFSFEWSENEGGKKRLSY